MALCIADIDDFKSFNTAFGYEAGNQVLAQVAQSLRRGVRPFDTVARWGGEEFAVLLTSPVHAEDVLAICERLRSAVERMPLQLEGLDRQSHRVGVTISLGSRCFPSMRGRAGPLACRQPGTARSQAPAEEPGRLPHTRSPGAPASR